MKFQQKIEQAFKNIIMLFHMLHTFKWVFSCQIVLLGL